MATFGDIDLRLDMGGGGIFEVPVSHGDSDFTYELDNGGDVVLATKSRVAIVRGIQISGHEEGIRLAREAANRALDISLTRGSTPVFLDHHQKPEVLWWHDTQGSKVRILSQTTLTARVSAGEVVVTNTQGEVVPQPTPPQVPFHESLRYYRISEATNDLFDSFRNLYLAIEALLSTVSPPVTRANGTPEPEGTWLKRVLRDVHNQVGLSQFAPTGNQAPYNSLFDELYGHLRTAIFHAKQGRTVWLPQEWSSRLTISEARQRYAQLFRYLAENYLQATFPGGGLSAYTFAKIRASMFDDAVVFVSDDPTRHADELKGEYKIAPAGGKVYKLPTHPDPVLSDDSTAAVIGTTSGEAVMANIEGIRRFGTLHGDNLALVENLTSSLNVSGVDNVEVAFLVTNRNHGAPKQDFDS